MNPGKINKVIAAGIFFIMLIIYLMTAAPTISFWDCGEFVTCSYIMGIPHPPGSPLLSLIGRVMALIPFYDFRGEGFGEIAYRVTLLDVFLGALTVMLTYLVLVKLIHKFRPYRDSLVDEAVIMFSSAVAALMIGFSDEFWTNAVEIETYMPSIFISILAVWLTLRWDERKNDPKAVRYLFLVAYILGLGNGIHLTVLLIAPTVAGLVYFAKPEWFHHLKLWIFMGVFGIAGAIIKFYSGMEAMYFTMAVFAFVAPVILYKMYMKRQEVWKLTLIGLILCSSLYIIGYSVYPTIAVRAGKNPSINEGNPDNWERYKLYMSRDQYAAGNMVEGMFTRSADFNYQFSFMYLRYLIQQFPKWGPSMKLTFENDKTADTRVENPLIQEEVYLAVLLLSLLIYGLYTHGREDWRRLVPLLMFFAVSSVGLVLYLNMANPQVRERPYFFLGSYYIIMYWIGFGIYGVIIDILDWLREKGKAGLITPVTAVLFVIFGTIPPVSVLSNHIDPEYTNYEVHDRTGDWVPVDYGYNILVSCEPNAILFTNGDNDTFPLWYLQEVEGFRTDVRVVNLSLLNTAWYNLQMKYEGKTIPIEYSDEYIETICGRSNEATRNRVIPAQGKEITAAGITWTLNPYIKYNEEYGVLRAADIMAVNIINWVNWSRPIYFAVTVAEENKVSIQDHLSMEGMVYRLVKEKAPSDGRPHVNVDALDDNVFNKYRYRLLNDPDVYKPPNTLKLTTNYFIGFASLADRYASMGDTENAVRAVWGAIENTPSDLSRRFLLYQIFAGRKLTDELQEFTDWEMALPEFTDGDFQYRYDFAMQLFKLSLNDLAVEIFNEITFPDQDFQYRYDFAMQLLRNSRDDLALEMFLELSEEQPANQEIWETLVAVYYSCGNLEEALKTIDKILEQNPEDERAIETKNIIQMQMQENESGDSLNVRQ
ncbi:protein O-mannosyl-transferase family [Candidatus Latescibacterota bacterium]